MADPVAVRAAFDALSPQPITQTAALAALNGQTVSLTQPASDVGLGDIQGVLLLSGDWLKIQVRAAGTITTGGTTDPVIVAQLAVQLVQGKAATVGAASWSSFLDMLNVLKTSTDVSQSSYDAISALAVMSLPKWSPPLNNGDLQNAGINLP